MTGGGRLSRHVTGKVHQRLAHHRLLQRVGNGEDMDGDGSGGVISAAEQDGRFRALGRPVFTFDLIDFFFLLGTIGSWRNGCPALTAGRRMALRRIAGWGRDLDA